MNTASEKFAAYLMWQVTVKLQVQGRCWTKQLRHHLGYLWPVSEYLDLSASSTSVFLFIYVFERQGDGFGRRGIHVFYPVHSPNVDNGKLRTRMKLRVRNFIQVFHKDTGSQASCTAFSGALSGSWLEPWDFTRCTYRMLELQVAAFPVRPQRQFLIPVVSKVHPMRQLVMT